MPPSRIDHRDHGVVRALGIGILTVVYMWAVGGEMPVYNDTTQDMLLARDGMASGTFAGGSRTTFPGIRMGELWVRMLAITFGLGLGVVAQQAIALMLAAVSTALFDRGVRRHFGDDIGLAPVAVFLPLVLVSIFYPIATQGYLGVPALVGSTLALLQVVTSGSTIAACVGGVSLAFAAELHPVTLLGVPAFVVAVAMTCRQPIRALVLAGASGLTAALTMSFHGWVDNARTLLHTPWCMPLVAGALAVALLVSALGRRRWRALEAGSRRVVLLIAIPGSIAAATVTASVLMRRTLFMPHYFLFGFPALAILVALGLRRWRDRGGMGRFAAWAIPGAVVLLHLSGAAVWKFGVATGTTSIPSYAMREAEILARRFWQNGYAFPDVQRHLRGPESRELLGAIAVFAPSADGTLERPMPDLRVLAFGEHHRPDAPMAADGEELDLGRGRRAWVLPLEGWVRLAPARVCFEPVSVESQPDCIDIASSSIAYTGRYRDLHERAFPALLDARTRLNGTSRTAERGFTWELPIEITGDDEERHVDVVGVIGVPPWRIERVDGVAYRGDLPARHVVLERSEKRSGRLVLAAAPSSMPLKNYPPDFLETRPAEAALRRSLQRLPPLGHLVCGSLGTCPDRDAADHVVAAATSSP